MGLDEQPGFAHETCFRQNGGNHKKKTVRESWRGVRGRDTITAFVCPNVFPTRRRKENAGPGIVMTELSLTIPGLCHIQFSAPCQPPACY